MVKSQSECEQIARILGLSDTTATTSVWNTNNCRGQKYYKCSFSGGLKWNPNCADNSNDERNIKNLCSSGMYQMKSTGELLLLCVQIPSHT